MKNSILGGILRAIATAAALLAAPAVAAHMQQAGGLRIIHPWATPGSGTSRVHPTLVNEGEGAIDLVSATTPAARVARLRLEDVFVATLSVPPGVTLTPSMMSRVALGHSGRAIVAAPLTVLAYVLVLLAGVLRVVASFDGDALLHLSAACWILGWSCFLAVYTPICIGRGAQGRLC